MVDHMQVLEQLICDLNTPTWSGELSLLRVRPIILSLVPFEANV